MIKRSLENKGEIEYWNFVTITAAQVDEWPQWMKGGEGRGNRGKTSTVSGDKSKSEMVIALFCAKCGQETPHVHFGQRNNDPPRAIRAGIIVPGLEWDGGRCKDWFECQKCREVIIKKNSSKKAAAR